MCGIAGFLKTGLDPARHDAVLEAMLCRILHRGPDEQGYLVDGFAALGNVRLSIVDLSSGSQPIATPDQRYWIVFNGEIFNFKELRPELEAEGARFRTQCDTEILLWGLALHGAEYIRRLNGQFSFCFYDRRERKAMFGRDRFGERPLHYAAFDGGLLFASEAKAFAAYPGFRFVLDPVAVNDTFTGWTAIAGSSAFEGVKQLEPGCYATFGPDGGFKTFSYDTVSGAAASADEFKGDFASACKDIREALTQSVRLRLRADLEVGAYVSGGLDSTITARLAQAELDTQLRTFSIRFADKNFDEGGYQALVRQQLKSDHKEFVVSQEDYLNAFERVIYHAEAPLYRLAPIPMFLLADLVRSSGLKVVLTGEGSDECFLGYDLYRELHVRLMIEGDTLDPAEKNRRIQALYPYLDHFRDDKVAGVARFFGSIGGRTEDPFYAHRARHTIGRFGARMMDKDVAAAIPDYAGRLARKLRERHPGFDALDPLERAIVTETETLMSGYLLSSQGDRMASAHAVEARFPFVDHEVFSAALRLPRDFRLKDGQREKHILKEAFRDLIPDSVIDRPKYPFRAPDGELMLGPAFRRFLPQRDELVSSGLFNADIVSRFIASLDPANIGQREMQALIVIVSTQMLYRQFVAGGMPAAPARLNNLTIRVDARGSIPVAA
jgi:asparagine synthase (glutamine-hydrolysing)